MQDVYWFFCCSVKAGNGSPPITAGIGVWLDGVGRAGMYGTAERMGGCSNQQLCEDRSTCRDQYENGLSRC